MIIYFTEAEESHRQAFREALPGHDLRFVSGPEEVGEDAEALSIFINTRLEKDFFAAHPRLRYIATRSGSADHLDLELCRAHGVQVSNVPKCGDHTVAEHTFALILALSRRLREVMSQPARGFSYESARAFDLNGKTLGIIGLGHIGRRVAELGRAFRMKVCAHDPRLTAPEKAAALGVEWVSFDELLARSHVLTLHVRLTPQTYHLLNREALAKCRPGVLIINTSRGRLIDTAALHDALESGQVGGAGLDVLEEESVLRQPASQVIGEQIVERLRSDNAEDAPPPGRRLKHLREIVSSDNLLARHDVVFTPHVAFNSAETVELLNRGTIENLRAYGKGVPINLVRLD